MLLNGIEKFAKKFGVQVFSKNSKFPKYYATHAITDVGIFESEFLVSSELLGKRSFSCEIDAYLDTTKYVFFSLGKGYLKSKNSIGLIYDPFVLAKVKGANIVMNDLLHVLSETDILQNFCNKNLEKFIEILEKNYQKIKTNKSKNEIVQIFVSSLSSGKNLLVAEKKEDILYGNIFELLLKLLPLREEKELKSILNKKIVKPNTIYKNLDKETEKVFSDQTQFLSKFFNETKEERIIELRIPKRHKITKGLIGIYSS